MNKNNEKHHIRYLGTREGAELNLTLFTIRKTYPVHIIKKFNKFTVSLGI